MKRAAVLLLILALTVSFAACGSTVSTETEAAPRAYQRREEDQVYQAALAIFDDYLEQAEKADSPDQRLCLLAQAEAALLDTAVILPMTAEGGVYTISRIAPHTLPCAPVGADGGRLSKAVICEDLITAAERTALEELWESAQAGGDPYDPAAWLLARGYALKYEYSGTVESSPATLDWLSPGADPRLLVNLADGLVEYDSAGKLCPALAESWQVSEDGLRWTFRIRSGVNWVTAAGKVYAPLTAGDLAAGLRHGLDTRRELPSGADGVIVGAEEYRTGQGDWESVGYRAEDESTLTVTLTAPVSDFPACLTDPLFLPLCQSFYQSKGGVLGEGTAEKFAKPKDVASQVYCGAYLPKKITDKETTFVRNAAYYRHDTTLPDTLKWTAGVTPEAQYAGTVAGIYTQVTVTEELRPLADRDLGGDGTFQTCAFLSPTGGETVFASLNLCRRTFSGENEKTEREKVSGDNAMQNLSFRKAVLQAIDGKTLNTVLRGEWAQTNLRNMLTSPTLSRLSAQTADGAGNRFEAGTAYGKMVQFYLDQAKAKITAADGTDGWYDGTAAKQSLARSTVELGDSVTYPIRLDLLYCSASPVSTAQAVSAKQSVEDVLGADRVQVNLVEEPEEQAYAARIEQGDFDLLLGNLLPGGYTDALTALSALRRGGSLSPAMGFSRS